jgi:hypothetical protein
MPARAAEANPIALKWLALKWLALKWLGLKFLERH